MRLAEKRCFATVLRVLDCLFSSLLKEGCYLTPGPLDGQVRMGIQNGKDLISAQRKIVSWDQADYDFALTVFETLDSRCPYAVGSMSWIYSVRYVCKREPHDNRKGVMKIHSFVKSRLSEAKIYEVLHEQGVPNIPLIYFSGSLGEHDGYESEVILMEYMDMSLRNHIQGMFSEGSGSHSKLIDVVAGYSATLLAAASADSPVLHRDISSGNLMVRRGNPVIIDWGFGLVLSFNERVEEVHHPPKTGTLIYMGLRVLQNASRRSVIDDFESLLFTIFHLVCLVCDPKQAKVDAIWDDQLEMSQFLEVRKNWLKDEISFIRKLPSNCPKAWEELLVMLYDLLFDRHGIQMGLEHDETDPRLLTIDFDSWAVLKLSWTPVKRLPEGAVYEVLHRSGINGIPKVYGCGLIKEDFYGYRLEYIILEHCGESIGSYVRNSRDSNIAESEINRQVVQFVSQLNNVGSIKQTLDAMHRYLFYSTNRYIGHDLVSYENYQRLPDLAMAAKFMDKKSKQQDHCNEQSNCNDSSAHSHTTIGDIEKGDSNVEHEAETVSPGDTENDPNVEDSPIEMVCMAVSNKDDPSMPCLTFRSWILGTTYGIDVVTIKRMWYKLDMGFGPSILFILTSQIMGYSFAGFSRRFLVYPAAMIWPSTLVSVTLFRAFHEIQDFGTRITRTQMFWVCFVGSFFWYFIPGVIFPALSFLAVLCFIAPNNIYANQLGDAFNGVGMLNFTLDWSYISSSYTQSPIAIPWVYACNVFAGFVLVMWIATPVGYYMNTWNTQLMPMYTATLYQTNGSMFDIDQVMTPDKMLDIEKYASYGPLRMTFTYAMTYGLSFAAITNLLVYIALEYGQDIVKRVHQARDMDEDIHMKLMRKYEEVPLWWYAVTFVVTFTLSIVIGEVWNMLPWYWVVLATFIPFIFTIPIGIVQALSNQQPGLNVITEFIIGYGRPGDPIANVTFKEQ
ncbi:hypothetical protein H4217_000922 [Coemansia sp. RSA 1939]|nr:hypothetical protein H4217_000922 [Coemansia sp. RSA 1939]